MKNTVQAQAARKVEEAMSGLRGALKEASPEGRREIHACMCELRNIKSEIDEQAFAAEQEQADPVFEDMDDEELAASALELAASALESASAEEEEAADEAEEEEEEEVAPEEEAADLLGEEFEEDEEEEDEEALDDEEALLDDESTDPEDLYAEDSEEVYSPEEIEQLRAEGLLEEDEEEEEEDEGPLSASVADRLIEVQARLNALRANEEFAGDDEFDGGDVDVLNFDDDEDEVTPMADGETYLSSAAMRDLWLSYTPAERRELRALNAAGADISAKKVSQSAYAKMAKKAKRNRKLRKYRGPVRQSKTGKKASITLPGGKKKKIKQKWHFSTYDSQGKFLGTFWMAHNKPMKSTMDAYQSRHSVKHPYNLSKVDPKKKWKM